MIGGRQRKVSSWSSRELQDDEQRKEAGRTCERRRPGECRREDDDQSSVCYFLVVLFQLVGEQTEEDENRRD